MPALVAFGTKWRIGSDDLVFPYIISLCTRLLWFCLFGYVVNTYDRDYVCEDEHLLRMYLCILTAIHTAMSIIEIGVIVISARGTMANPAPRNSIHVVLYVEAAVFLLKFTWDVVGVLWAFDPSIDCETSHPILLLTRGILLWNLFTSITMASYAILRIGICRLPCVGPKYRHLAESLSSDIHGLLAISSSELHRHRRRDSDWKWRLEWLCCCLKLRGSERSAYGDIATVMADSFTYFRGYVPSDVAAGIALMAMEQETQTVEDWESNLHREHRKPLNFKSSSVSAHYNRVVHYMRFAMATYGWRLFAYKNGMKGICSTTYRMCCGCSKKDKQEEEVFQATGDTLGWDMKTLRHLTNLQDSDILYASFVSEVFCPAFFVAYDHSERAVVIAIRGTLSIKDALTDLSSQPALLTTSEKGDFFAHKGMIAAAHAIQLKLEREGVLEKVFEENSSYSLVIVGHSLGGGVASLLAILLKIQYANVQCYAYSPPGGLLCMTAVPKTRSYITSVVVENDFIPRLSMQNLQSFSEKVLRNIQTSAVPKYRIFLSSALQWLGVCGHVVRRMGNRRVSVSTMAILKEPLLNTHFDDSFDEEDIYEAVEDIYDEVAGVEAAKRNDLVTGKQDMQIRERMPLFLPGRIIHITRDTPRGGFCGLCRRRPVRAHWTTQSEFSELKLERNMMRDHTPDRVFKMLAKLQKQEKLQQV